MGKLILNGIEYAGGPSIDDTNSSATKVYSSQKTQNLVSGTLGADVYDPTHTYATNDMCIYNNTLYKAKSSTTGNLPSDTTYWEPTTIADEINELNMDKQDKLSNSDIPITVLSQSVSDVTLKCTKYGNVACITGYFRTTASISANSSIFSGFPNPVVPRGDSNIYFIFQNETDNTVMRFRINRNYCELKNPVALASGKTFVGAVTYICD